MAVADVAGGATYWLVRGHLDLSFLVGYGAGGMLIAPIAALSHRARKPLTSDRGRSSGHEEP
jgi:hypothetical protein